MKIVKLIFVAAILLSGCTASSGIVEQEMQIITGQTILNEIEEIYEYVDIFINRQKQSIQGVYIDSVVYVPFYMLLRNVNLINNATFNAETYWFTLMLSAYTADSQVFYNILQFKEGENYFIYQPAGHRAYKIEMLGKAISIKGILYLPIRLFQDMRVQTGTVVGQPYFEELRWFAIEWITATEHNNHIINIFNINQWVIDYK